MIDSIKKFFAKNQKPQKYVVETVWIVVESFMDFSKGLKTKQLDAESIKHAFENVCNREIEIEFVKQQKLILNNHYVGRRMLYCVKSITENDPIMKKLQNNQTILSLFTQAANLRYLITVRGMMAIAEAHSHNPWMSNANS